MKLQTVRRNTKRYWSLIDAAADVRVMRLDNGFAGERVPKLDERFMATVRARPTCHLPALTIRDEKTAVLHFHSNHWVEWAV